MNTFALYALPILLVLYFVLPRASKAIAWSATFIVGFWLDYLIYGFIVS